jgi:hypothetical protein
MKANIDVRAIAHRPTTTDREEHPPAPPSAPVRASGKPRPRFTMATLTYGTSVLGLCALTACDTSSNEHDASANSAVANSIPLPTVPSTPCGGINEVICVRNGHAICQPGLTNLGGTCGVPPTVLSLATLGVTGPLPLQGVTPWTDLFCSGVNIGGSRPSSPADGSAWTASASPTTGVDAQSSLRWALGSGLSVTDANVGQTPPKFYVPTPNVTLAATVSFNDDSSALELWTPSGMTWCGQSFMPAVFEGNHAHYTVTVQSWVDNAASCAAPQSTDPDYPPVYFNAPSPDGNPSGCWVDLASGQTDLYGSSYGAASATVAAQDGSVSTTVNVPVTLAATSSYLRYVVNVLEGDSRDPAAEAGVQWSQASVQTGPELQNDLCNPDCVLLRPAQTNGFVYSQALEPFQLVVLPLALAQLKVLPYTLLYAAPGNASSTTYQTTASFGVSMTFDNKVENDTANKVDNTNTNGVGLSVTELLGEGDDKTSGVSDTLMASSTWDQSTQTGVGTINDAANNQTSSYQSIFSWKISDPTLTPGANGTVNGAPFWDDTFVLLVHPQIGLWQIGGAPIVSLLAARGTPASPDFSLPTVKDLDACARGVAPHPSGYPIAGTSDVLTSAECAELLTLDPFYGEGFVQGQAAPWLTPSFNSRFTSIASTPYGVIPPTAQHPNEVDQAITLNDILTYTNTQTQQSVGSYTATVQDVITTSVSFGSTMTVYGVSGSENFSNTDTATTGTTWTVTLQSSYAATAQSSVSITGALDDQHGLQGSPLAGTALPYQPYTNVYRDMIFGTFLFQDPAAPEVQLRPNCTYHAQQHSKVGGTVQVDCAPGSAGTPGDTIGVYQVGGEVDGQPNSVSQVCQVSPSQYGTEVNCTGAPRGATDTFFACFSFPNYCDAESSVTMP